MKPKLTVDEDGTKRWLLNGKLHREDGPAIIRPDGYQAWYLNNKLHHNGNRPSITFPDGRKYWHISNKFHREDGPAIIDDDGSVEYWAFGTKYSTLEELQIGVILSQ